MTKERLDVLLAKKAMVGSRSEAESWIKLGRVQVGGRVVTKPGTFVTAAADIELSAPERYVSRAGLKLASVAQALGLDFAGKIVMDVGSSTGGFTDYALQHGAAKVFAIDVGTDQLHPTLRSDPRVELHEKTDIRDFTPSTSPDIVVMDVSFVSSRLLLPHIARVCGNNTAIVVMVKPQFEAAKHQIGRSGVVKNDRIRREIIHSFEQWAKQRFVIRKKADSEVKGASGNAERFYLLQNLGQ